MTNIQVLKGTYQHISRLIPQSITTTSTTYFLFSQHGGVGGGSAFFAIHSLFLEGSGFTYSGNVLTGGTITRISFTREAGSSS